MAFVVFCLLKIISLFLLTLILIDSLFDSLEVRLLAAHLWQLLIRLRETCDLGGLVKATLSSDDDSSGHRIDFND